MDPLTTISTRRTVQTLPANERQVKNSAGGYVFQVGDDARVHRFLTIGTTGGTYYSTEQDHTKDNADVVIRAARERGEWLVGQIVQVSTAGRAPKQNPAIFALAAVAGLGDEPARKAALEALPAVCRIGTHLFLFVRYVEQFRGWGPALRRAVGSWYLDRDVDDLTYQAVKYRQRDGWSHRDLLRLAHPLARATPETVDPARRALFSWISTGGVEVSRAPGKEKRAVGATAEDLPALVSAFTDAQAATSVREWVRLIEQHAMSWEMLPDAALTEPAVWRALVAKGLPQTALIRQLPRLTRLGVLDGDTLQTIVAQLQDPEKLRRARVHPVNVLVALRTYVAGRSARGDGQWTPNRRIIDALDAAFYLSFGTVEPAGKRTLLALDVSGSMGDPAGGLPISCREVTAALALVMMATEPNCDVVGFTAGRRNERSVWGHSTAISELPISPRQRLDDAIRSISNIPFGGTDCSLPLLWALEQGRQYDTVVVMTDNETWAGSVHPHQALARYREQTSIPTRLAVVGMTATNFTIADPTDPGQLDIAGFDSAVPSLITDFSRGDV